MEEQAAVYDTAGHVVGSAPRSRIRAEGLWHAAAAVLVLSGDGEWIYVHRRTDTKDVYPGLYDCTAGGVVAAGESPEQTAQRELTEELGVTSPPRFLFQDVFEDGAIRYHAFVYETRWDGPIRHQPEEIAEGGWMSLRELRRRLEDPTWPVVPDGAYLTRTALNR